MKPNLEIKTYTHKGVNVTVKIDYDREQISLVEKAYPDRDWNGEYANKKWVFAIREINYMDSWIVILDAMRHAIKEAKRSLEIYLEAQDLERKKNELDLSIELYKIGEKPLVDIKLKPKRK